MSIAAPHPVPSADPALDLDPVDDAGPSPLQPDDLGPDVELSAMSLTVFDTCMNDLIDDGPSFSVVLTPKEAGILSSIPRLQPLYSSLAQTIREGNSEVEASKDGTDFIFKDPNEDGFLYYQVQVSFDGSSFRFVFKKADHFDTFETFIQHRATQWVFSESERNLIQLSGGFEEMNVVSNDPEGDQETFRLIVTAVRQELMDRFRGSLLFGILGQKGGPLEAHTEEEHVLDQMYATLADGALRRWFMEDPDAALQWGQFSDALRDPRMVTWAGEIPDEMIPFGAMALAALPILSSDGGFNTPVVLDASTLVPGMKAREPIVVMTTSSEEMGEVVYICIPEFEYEPPEVLCEAPESSVENDEKNPSSGLRSRIPTQLKHAVMGAVLHLAISVSRVFVLEEVEGKRVVGGAYGMGLVARRGMEIFRGLFSGKNNPSEEE